MACYFIRASIVKLSACCNDFFANRKQVLQDAAVLPVKSPGYTWAVTYIKSKAKHLSIFLFIGLAIAVSIYLYFEIHAPVVKEYTVSIKNLPATFDGFTILQISDLHAKEYGRNQQGLIDLIRQHEFDIAVLTGDMIDRNNFDPTPAVRLTKRLGNKPIFFVAGNHDVHSDGRIKPALSKAGVVLLENKAINLNPKGGQGLWLIGIDVPYHRNRSLDAAMSTVHKKDPKILLAHYPTVIKAAAKADIDLVLAGHTHGGQISMPFFGAIFAPGQGFFPKYTSGSFALDRTKMIISGGLGESIIPIRVNARPEIVFIKLMRGS